MSRRLVQVVLAALCLTVFAGSTSAQVFTGRLDVVAKDPTGAIVPGVTVELTGPQTARSVTDAQGEAHFVNLAPGRYTLTATLSGFRDYKNDNVVIGAGSIISLPVTMAVGGVTEAVTVQSVTPVIEAKRTAIQTNVTLDELQNIPSSRDPWVVLQTVPGIIVDRVNVGGAESGQQSVYQAKGASDDDNTWNMDGISITDMAAIGSSPTYYDFDMFQEMQVTTGGADPANPTPGVHLNFVLRSGTNNWRGSARYYFENNDLQSDNVTDALRGTLQSYNRMEYYKDYGVEGGGPIVKDKLFVWGAYGFTNPALEIYTYRPSAGNVFRTDPGCKGAGQFHPATADTYAVSARDCTELENYSAKATYNVSDRLRANFTYFRGDKLKFGRGAAANRPAPTTFNQKGPTDLYKGEASYSLSNTTFLTARFAYTGGGFSFDPIGGYETQTVLDDDNIWQNTYWYYITDRPQTNFNIDGNHFRGNHELKFGFGWRKSSVASQSGYPQGILTLHSGLPDMIAQFTRNWAQNGNTVYWNAFLGDTITADRLTLNLGVRWDRQVANLESAFVEGNPWTADPIVMAAHGGRDLMPALSGSARDAVVTYNSVTPRLGLAYALNESRRTIARASYAMFASQLSSARGYFVSEIPGTPTGSGYVYWLAIDSNGDGLVQPGELVEPLDTGCSCVGFDPDSGVAVNRFGDVKVPLTHELLFGLEHEVARNFGISGTVTWRHLNNFSWSHIEGVTGASYSQIGTYSGDDPVVGSFNVPLYGVDAAVVPSDRRQIQETRDGYYQRYLGFELSALKRMSENWMMRLGFSSNVHREYFDTVESLGDPTPSPTSPKKDGGDVVTLTSGSGKGNIYMVLPRYQFIATGAYQAKWGINLGVNYLLRQGYSLPYFRTQTPESADLLSPSGKTTVLVDVAERRLDPIHSVDARVSKNFTFNNRYRIDLDLDVFNLVNSNAILARNLSQSSGTFNRVTEIMNPRILRLGVRVGF